MATDDEAHVSPDGDVVPFGAARVECDEFMSSVPSLAARWNELDAAFEQRADEKGLAGYIDRCVTEGRPASLIRLGDGEGNLLALGLDEHQHLARACARGASWRHLGDPEAYFADPTDLRPALHDALRTADVIGFPGPFHLPHLVERTSAARPTFGVASVLQYLLFFAEDLGLGTKIAADSDFHHDLLPEYPGLVAGRRVGLVSCHERLVRLLRNKLRATEVVFHAVPKQAVLRRNRMRSTGHYPDRYVELIDELGHAEPGTLYLVAAGILGKIYCGVLRRAGAVAVDIGSAADVWTGVRSRWSIKPATLDRWRLTNPAASGGHFNEVPLGREARTLD